MSGTLWAKTVYEDLQGRFAIGLPEGWRPAPQSIDRAFELRLAGDDEVPEYLMDPSYGLWQVIDFDKGVFNHSNIGMDSSRYELSESRSYYPYKKAKTVNMFLIAQPVKIPR